MVNSLAVQISNPVPARPAALRLAAMAKHSDVVAAPSLAPVVSFAEVLQSLLDQSQPSVESAAVDPWLEPESPSEAAEELAGLPALDGLFEHSRNEAQLALQRRIGRALGQELPVFLRLQA